MKKTFIVSIFMIFSIINVSAQESNGQTKPIAKTIGGMVVCGGAVFYGAVTGPFVTLFGVVDGCDGQVIVGPLITTISIPAFYYGRKLFKSGLKDLDALEKKGIDNPLKEITNWILKKEKYIQTKLSQRIAPRPWITHTN